MLVANIPLIMIWLWFALRARNLLFFSTANPVIETGGWWGESKYNILKRIPDAYKPKTVLIEKGSPWKQVVDKVSIAGISYPLIAKPNIGERGFMVKKISSEEDLSLYHQSFHADFLIQEFVSLPLELAVMHHRYPDERDGSVTSVCFKNTLKICGDGESSIRELMGNNIRAKFQLQRFEKESPGLLDKVPDEGHIVELEPIGNHCRGTKFLNGNRFIDERLHEVFNIVARQMDEIYYGRFDLKCDSIEAVKNGGRFLIMEYNGIGAEPAHIYDPEYPFLSKYADIYNHWKIIYQIYRKQNERGVKAMNIPEAWRSLINYLRYMRAVKKNLKS